MIKFKNILALASIVLLSSKVYSQGDNCSNATTITVTANCSSPVAGTSAGATQSFAGCVGTADDDVWYKFTATATSHVITVTPSASYDPVVELFSGTCSSLTSLYCRDNGMTGDAETIYATGLTIGNTYYIRVYHYYTGSGSNTFTICVTSPPSAPANDNCSSASTLVVNTSCSFTNGTSYGATASSVPACAGSPDDDVWYKFTATNSVQTITVDPSTNMDPVVELFSGTCSSLSSLYCQDAGYTDGNEVINAVGLIPGQTYYIRVYDYYNSNGGYPFQICVTGTATATPVNDECATAIELPEVTSECNYYYFTTTGATNSTTTPLPTNCENFDGTPNAGGFSTSSKDVWFKIKVPANGKLSIRPMPAYGINDAAMVLYSGSCGSLTQIACSDDHNYPGTANDMKPYINVSGLTPGSYVYLRYWGFGSTSGDFAICVESPTNDACSNSLQICDINGYAGSTSSAYTADRPGNMRGNAEVNDPPTYTYTPGTCQPGGIFGLGGSWGTGAPNCDVQINNNSWIKFTASNTSVTLNVNISNCWVGSYPSGGIQMQIFSGNSCSNFAPVSDFKEGSSTFSITANNLTVGQEYYLMIDGFAGDICDYSITANTGVQFTDISATSTSICPGQSVTLTAPSGATSYLWSPGGQTTQSITVSPATSFTYSCEVSGVCNFKQTLYKTVVVNPLPTISTSNNSPLCQGSTLNLTSSGGSTYQWSGPNGFTSTQQNPSITNVTTAYTGTYNVTVTSSAGCSSTATTNVTVNAAPASPTVSATSTTICNGQSTTINASGSGASLFQVYNSSSGGTLLGTTPLNVSPTTTTTYYVQAVSSSGCVNLGGRVPVTITVNPLPTPSISSNSGICAGQTLQLNASGGTAFQWSGPNGFTSTQQNPSIPSATTAATGTYTVTVTNSYNCSAVTSTYATVNTLPNATASSNSAICSGQTLNLYANGGTTYTWSGPGGYNSTNQNPVITNATTSYSGTYYVTVSNGTCSSTTSVSVTVNASPNVSISSNSPLCTGNTLQLNASGGSSYQWSGVGGFSSTQQNPTIPNAQLINQGTYTVTVTSSSGCTATASTDVYISSSFNSTINPAGPFCSNGSPVTLTAATPGGTWSGNGITDASLGIFNPTTAGVGTHTITYTISGSCGSSSNANIIVYQSPTAIVSSNSPICEGQSLQLNANNVSNASYLWSGPNSFSSSQQNPTLNNASINNSGSYSLTITDANQCSAISSVNVTINPSPTVTITTSNPICNGSTLNISATSGYSSYSWQGPNNFQSSQSSFSIPNVSNLQSGTYTVTVINSNGCSKVESTVVNVLNFASGSMTVNTITPSCYNSTDGSIELFVTGGTPPYQYHWSHDTSLTLAQANNLSDGIYTITITDGNGCNIDTLIHLTAPTPLQIDVTTQNPNCFGIHNGNITVQVSGGSPAYSYLWNNNSTSATLNQIGPGIYSVTVTDNHQCSTVFNNIQITEPDELILNLNATNNQCPTDNLASASVTVYGGVSPYTYQWNTGQTSSSINQISGGYHAVTVTDANQCNKTDSIFVISPDGFINNAVVIRDTINGIASIDNQVSGGTPPYQYAWSNGQTSEDLYNIEAGTYILTVTDASNCTFVDTFDIKLPILIPTVYTPNGDNTNDRFAIKNIHIVPQVHIEIYNRWGNKMFSFDGTGSQYANQSNQWDGTYNGKELPMGSFVYIVIVNNSDVHNGVVSILR
jgi:gliding motility-associated-like protein